MFRKYYKEANDSIKPDENFVNSVINNAKKHKPPLRTRYVRYAAMAAAAAVIITGAVTAMPVLQRTSQDSDEIVIIEETVTDESAAETPAPAEKNGDAHTAPSSIQKPEQKNTPSHNTSESSYRVPDNSPPKTYYFPAAEPVREEMPEADESNNMSADESLAGDTAMVDETVSDDTAADEYGTNDISTYDAGGFSITAVLGETSAALARKMSEPEDMTPYAEKQDLSDISGTEDEVIDDADIPCPDGYYCINSTPNGYTFKNDSGAVISVTINYGGADREPYISEDGDSIYAVFTSFGLSVTINAYGADMETVEEIINQFR